MVKPTEFITFGFGQKVGDYELDNHYMIVDRGEAAKFLDKNDAGFLVFAFSYPIEELELQLFKHDMIEITKEQYLEYQAG